MTNNLKKEEPQSSDLYPRLAADDQRRILSDRVIMEEYITVETSFNPEGKRSISRYAVQVLKGNQLVG